MQSLGDLPQSTSQCQQTRATRLPSTATAHTVNQPLPHPLNHTYYTKTTASANRTNPNKRKRNRPITYLLKPRPTNIHIFVLVPQKNQYASNKLLPQRKWCTSKIVLTLPINLNLSALNNSGQANNKVRNYYFKNTTKKSRIKNSVKLTYLPCTYILHSFKCLPLHFLLTIFIQREDFRSILDPDIRDKQKRN